MSYEQDPSAHINRFVEATIAAAESLSKSRDEKITPEQVREALVSALHVEDQVELLKLDLSAETMVGQLETFNFVWLRPVMTLTFDASLLPSEVPGRLDERQIKHKGEIWRIYENDADPFPSNPHAHNVETGYKLHLGNGGLYRKRERIGAISAKHLLAIREKAEGVNLPRLER